MPALGQEVKLCTGVCRNCRDIMSGNFKGFAMLRQMTLAQPDKLLPGWETQHKPQPVYVEVSLPAIAPGYLAPCGSDSDYTWS